MIIYTYLDPHVYPVLKPSNHLLDDPVFLDNGDRLFYGDLKYSMSIIKKPNHLEEYNTFNKCGLDSLYLGSDLTQGGSTTMVEYGFTAPDYHIQWQEFLNNLLINVSF